MEKVNFKTLFLFVLFLFIGISCEKNIIIDIPEGEKKIVVNGILAPGNTVKINISKSLYILESDYTPPIYITDADVQLFENGQFMQNLVYVDLGNYNTGFQVEGGKTYRFEISVPGLEPVSAETRIPGKIEILQLDTATIKNSDGYYDNFHYKLKFNDPVHEENYYMITVFQSNVNSPDEFYLIGSSSQDAVIGLFTTNNQQLIFSDEVINGKTAEIVFQTHDFYSGDIVKVDFSHISREYYLYLKSLTLHYQTKNNPFAEPVQVYNNIEKGYGIIGAFNPYSDTIFIK